MLRRERRRQSRRIRTYRRCTRRSCRSMSKAWRPLLFLWYSGLFGKLRAKGRGGRRFALWQPRRGIAVGARGRTGRIGRRSVAVSLLVCKLECELVSRAVWAQRTSEERAYLYTPAELMSLLLAARLRAETVGPATRRWRWHRQGGSTNHRFGSSPAFPLAGLYRPPANEKRGISHQGTSTTEASELIHAVPDMTSAGLRCCSHWPRWHVTMTVSGGASLCTSLLFFFFFRFSS